MAEERIRPAQLTRGHRPGSLDGRSGIMTGEGRTGSRADVEPMIIDGTDVYVFYRKIQPDGARFWRAKVYT